MTTEPFTRFPTTNWTMIGRAAGCDRAAAEALARILGQYAPVMRAHLIRKGRVGAHEADDRIQEFLTVKFLEQNLVSKAQRERGKFRSFVLTALDRFLVSEHRKESAAKRGGKQTTVSLEQAPVDTGMRSDDVARTFDVEWGRRVVQSALDRMQAYCEEVGRRDLWGVFAGRVARPALESHKPAAYADLVREYGFESPAHASNALMNGKRMFRRMLQAVVGEYVCSEDEIEDELNDLMRVLSRG